MDPCETFETLGTFVGIESPVEQMLAPDDEAQGSPFSQQAHSPLFFAVWCFHRSLVANQ